MRKRIQCLAGALVVLSCFGVAAWLWRVDGAEARLAAELGPAQRVGPAEASLPPDAAARRVRLVGGRWRCDQAELFAGRQSAAPRAWVPVEDANGEPRVVLLLFGAEDCRPSETVTGYLSRDGGAFGATLPARGALMRLGHLPVLVAGRRVQGSLSRAGPALLMGGLVAGVVWLRWRS